MEDKYEGPYYEISPIHGAINFLPFSELRLPIDVGHVITPDCEEYKEFVEMFADPSISRITLHPAGFLLRNYKGFWNIYPSGSNMHRDYVPVPEDHHKVYRFKNTSIFALKANGLAPGWFTKKLGVFWWQEILEVHDDKLLVRSAWDAGWQPGEEWIDEKDIYAVRPKPPLWCDFFDNRGFYLKRGILVEYKSS